MSNAKNMSNHERAIKAAQERWNPTAPKATHTGVLMIAGQEIHCDVLNDGRRILRQKTLLNAMGKGKPSGEDVRRGLKDNLPLFVTAANLKPYLQKDFLERGAPIHYKGIDGRKLIGYEATVLPEACKIYVQAEHDDVLQENQLKIASVCKSMLYGLATVGITALVDEATGYEFAKQRNELQIILQKYISKDLMPWTKRFPDEFFEQVYRIHGWNWPKVNKNHPQCVGNFINRYVYDSLPEVVQDELKRINPPNENGNRLKRHHQYLTDDIGNKTLEKQVAKIVTMMQLADNMEQFKKFAEKC